ncbi:hypothetical protein BS17DRAFT_685433, partial [Gyrodon lividus]
AKSAITPLSPGPGDIYTAGRSCSSKWKIDPTGTWRNVTLELMSGSNYNMSLVMRVVGALDGTTESAYNFTCPNVAPNSNIYFYQARPPSKAFNNADVENSVWTARFTIASPIGIVTPPEYSQQPGGSPIAWGNGRL